MQDTYWTKTNDIAYLFLRDPILPEGHKIMEETIMVCVVVTQQEGDPGCVACRKNRFQFVQVPLEIKMPARLHGTLAARAEKFPDLKWEVECIVSGGYVRVCDKDIKYTEPYFIFPVWCIGDYEHFTNMMT